MVQTFLGSLHHSAERFRNIVADTNTIEWGIGSFRVKMMGRFQAEFVYFVVAGLHVYNDHLTDVFRYLDLCTDAVAVECVATMRHFVAAHLCVCRHLSLLVEVKCKHLRSASLYAEVKS